MPFVPESHNYSTLQSVKCFVSDKPFYSESIDFRFQ